MPTPQLTNRAFGERVGIDHSMASRIKNGQRLPGIDVIERIAKEYGIRLEVLLAARKKGSAEFGKLIRRRVYRLAA